MRKLQYDKCVECSGSWSEWMRCLRSCFDAVDDGGSSECKTLVFKTKLFSHGSSLENTRCDGFKQD